MDIDEIETWAEVMMEIEEERLEELNIWADVLNETGHIDGTAGPSNHRRKTALLP